MKPSIFICAVALALPACGGGESSEKDIAKSLSFKEEKKEAKKEEKADAAPKEKKLELPWTFEQVREALRGGATLIYKQTGTDAKGKSVEDDFKCEVKKSSGDEVGTNCNGVNHPSKDKGAAMVASAEWSQYSPFFSVDRVEKTLVGFEEVTVPAGTFPTVKAELKGFFGNSYTVWMIEDKPGIYAKAIKHANAGEENDQTELTFELAEITMGKAEGG
jgi:hypothetical protein